jgi:glycosyltransferase involved in cell wall biosynthesis
MSGGMPGRPPRVSVVVPTHGRPELLARCLAALAAQQLGQSDYEVIVVDDGPSEATRRVVEAQTAGRCLSGVCLCGAVGAGVSGRCVTAATSREVAAGRLTLAADAGGPAASPGSVSLATLPMVVDRGGRPPAAPDDCPVPADHSAYTAPAAEATSGSAPLASVAGGQAAGHEPGLSVTYLPLAGAHGPAAARNAGWRAARAEIIAFTDDDCIPAPGWLRAGLAAFEDHGDTRVVGVSGQVVMPLPLQPTDYELNAAGLQRSDFVTANCFYRRDEIAAVGGFDERFRAPWREDSDLFFSLVERHRAGPVSLPGWPGDEGQVLLAGRGAVFVRAPRAVVFHPVRPAPWGVSLRQQRKAMFNALLYKKHPALYRQRLAPVTPWHYYGILASLGACLAAFLAEERALAYLAGLAWFLLTARFCLQRLRQTARTPSHIAEMAITSALVPLLSLFWRLAGAIRFRVLFF